MKQEIQKDELVNELLIPVRISVLDRHCDLLLSKADLEKSPADFYTAIIYPAFHNIGLLPVSYKTIKLDCVESAFISG